MLSITAERNLVLEFAEEFVRIGIAGESRPRFGLKSTLPVLSSGGLPLRLHFGNLLREIFYDYLHVKPKLCQVLVLEPVFWPKIVRDSLFTTLINDFQVHSVSFQPNLFAVSLAVGSSVSLIVNVGLDSCETIAVSDNRPMLSTYHQSPVGIRNILQAIVQATGNDEITLDSLLKWSTSTITPSLDESTVETALLGMIVGGISETDTWSLTELILETLLKCSTDDRSILLRHICLVGEGSKIKILENLLMDRLVAACSTAPKYDTLANTLRQKHNNTVNSFPTPFAGHLMAWIGGSLFAATPGNQTRYVQRENSNIAAKVGEGDSSRRSVPDDLQELLSTPDWLSVDKKDWTFIGPTVR